MGLAEHKVRPDLALALCLSCGESRRLAEVNQQRQQQGYHRTEESDKDI
jgi:hypothetical protein